MTKILRNRKQIHEKICGNFDENLKKLEESFRKLCRNFDSRKSSVALGKRWTPPFIEVKSKQGISRLMSTFFRKFQQHIWSNACYFIFQQTFNAFPFNIHKKKLKSKFLFYVKKNQALNISASVFNVWELKNHCL